MKYIIPVILLTINLFVSSLGYGQSLQQAKDQLPVIHVTGTAEKEIIPDEIYITIRLEEYTGSKKQNHINQLDTQLRELLIDHGFKLENLYLSDAKSNRIHLKRKPIVQALQYTLVVSSAKETEQVFDILNTLKIRKAYIAKTSHSKLEEFRKEVRIQAIKTAKDKANYILTAIGESCGKPIEIREQVYSTSPMFSNVKFEMKQDEVLTNLPELPEIELCTTSKCLDLFLTETKSFLRSILCKTCVTSSCVKGT